MTRTELLKVQALSTGCYYAAVAFDVVVIVCYRFQPCRQCRRAFRGFEALLAVCHSHNPKPSTKLAGELLLMLELVLLRLRHSASTDDQGSRFSVEVLGC